MEPAEVRNTSLSSLRRWRGCVLLVCGSRHYRNSLVIEQLIKELRPMSIIHGGARGADTLAGNIGAALSIPVVVFPAEWRRYGRAAGPRRNQKMLDEGKPDVVLACPLPGSKGTLDMVRRAMRAGIPTIVVED